MDCCEPVCRGERRLTPGEWEKYPELRPQAEDLYDLVEGILVSRAWLVGDHDHTQIFSVLCSLIGRVWKDRRLVKGLYGPSLKLRSRKVALRFRGSEEGHRRKYAESGGPSFSESEKSTEWRRKENRTDGLGR